MSNMDYCQFENTYSDFIDCLNTIQEKRLEELSYTEKIYCEKLYDAAKEYIEQYEYLVNN